MHLGICFIWSAPAHRPSLSEMPFWVNWLMIKIYMLSSRSMLDQIEKRGCSWPPACYRGSEHAFSLTVFSVMVPVCDPEEADYHWGLLLSSGTWGSSAGVEGKVQTSICAGPWWSELGLMKAWAMCISDLVYKVWSTLRCVLASTENLKALQHVSWRPPSGSREDRCVLG